MIYLVGLSVSMYILVDFLGVFLVDVLVPGRQGFALPLGK